MTRRVGFMFAGQGAQFVGMGRDLVETSPAARDVFEKADSVLQRSISLLCFSGSIEQLTASANCQPAVYAMALACLAAFRERCPLDPVVCGGLSLGEFSALTAAGALEFAAGLRLVATRGALMDQACKATDGAMAAVLNAEPGLVEATCAEHGIEVANYNCPGQIVISGPRPGVAAAVAALQQKGVAKIVALNVAGAYHSRLMAPAAEQFVPVLRQTTFRRPSCPVAQNVVGALAEDPQQIRENLERQVTGSVKWEACTRAMLAAGIEVLIEFGPGQVLSGFMRRIDRQFPTCSVSNTQELAKAVASVAG